MRGVIKQKKKEECMKVRTWMLVSMVMGMGLVIAFGASTEAKDLTKMNFQLNWKITGDHAPYYVALKKGWFQEEGLDVNVLLGQGSAYTVQA
ncbi:MAG: hypothetical protein EHM36_05120, partial [Deltaproteobacteria bacterium]